MFRKIAWLLLAVFAIGLLLPERAEIPVEGASSRDWHPQTFWYEPWGRSGVHKGIDVFAAKGKPVISASYGIVLFSGELPRGGNVVAALGPKWRIHYYAHLDQASAYPGMLLSTGTPIGTVGDSGNAQGKPAHLHYSVVTLLPYPWRMDDATQGWKKMFYLDPGAVLGY